MAASQIHFDAGKENEPGLVHFYGSITTADAEVATATACGKGMTYISDGAGTYTVTLDKAYKSYVYIGVTAPHLVSTNNQLVWLSGTTAASPSTGKVTFYTSTTVNGAAEDVGTEFTFYFHIVAKNTSI
jgi:hypothetical protein